MDKPALPRIYPGHHACLGHETVKAKALKKPSQNELSVKAIPLFPNSSPLPAFHRLLGRTDALFEREKHGYFPIAEVYKNLDPIRKALFSHSRKCRRKKWFLLRRRIIGGQIPMIQIGPYIHPWTDDNPALTFTAPVGSDIDFLNSPGHSSPTSSVEKEEYATRFNSASSGMVIEPDTGATQISCTAKPSKWCGDWKGIWNHRYHSFGWKLAKSRQAIRPRAEKPELSLILSNQSLGFRTLLKLDLQHPLRHRRRGQWQ